MESTGEFLLVYVLNNKMHQVMLNPEQTEKLNIFLGIFEKLDVIEQPICSVEREKIKRV
jgi:hypothetical protein